jgi:peptidoglycan/xylan/chitin deacetylase (PgdA/CDA1 family)
MLVFGPRSLLTFAVGALPVLLPTLGGGSDVSRASQPDWPAPAAVEAPVDATPSKTVPLWSPGHGPHTGFQPSQSPRELLLSFDDGPDLKGTPLILDELDRRGLKAIFFVTGWRLTGQRPDDVARRELVRKIAAHGHLVANHTFSHHNLCENPKEQAAQIDDNAELIAETTGVHPLLFRSPYGAFCHSLEVTLAARDLPDIGWNLDPQDWKSDNETAVYDYLVGKLARLKGRGILLLHDTHFASVRALPRVLDWLAGENRRAVADGRPPVTIIDYDVVVPHRPTAESGLEQVVGAVVGGVIADLSPLWAVVGGEGEPPFRASAPASDPSRRHR